MSYSPSEAGGLNQQRSGLSTEVPESGTDTDILVIGAGPAGLAVAGCLVARGLRPLVIEKSKDIASAWRRHYDRLHLHTVKEHSALPGLPFPRDYPRYVPRDKVLDYLSSYAAHFDISPRLGAEATSISRAADGRWQTTTRTAGRFLSNAVVVATGANARPSTPRIPGRDAYGGEVMHSRDYRNAARFVGKRVLVVGMGNTGAEIALDLAEHRVEVAISLRSPVNIVYRDMLRRPTQLTSIALSRLPESWGDVLARLLRDLTVGDLRRYGIATPAASPLRDLRRHGRTPVIDVGTLARIKSGDIEVRPGIRELTAEGARFTDGTEARFDAIILATGYHATVPDLLPQAGGELDDKGLPRSMTGEGPLAGLFFVGFDVRQAGGLLRTIGLQAQAVAAVLSSRRQAAQGAVTS